MMNIMTLYKKLFMKKWQLLVLGVVVILCALMTRIISIDHWESLNWEVTGYHPYLAPLGLLWMGAYIAVLYLRKIHALSLWVMGISGIVYFAIMYWMVNL